MKFSALALDYDGTIATDGVFDPAVREAVGEVRQRGIVVILVTGRRLADLHAVGGDLTCFDAIVGENGAVLKFPHTQPNRARRFLKRIVPTGGPAMDFSSNPSHNSNWIGADATVR